MLGYHATTRGYVAHFETYIFEWRCTVHSEIHVYLLIHCLWRYSKKDKSTIVLELRAKNYLRIELLRAKLAKNFGENWHSPPSPLPPPPNWRKVFIFFHKRGQIFSAFSRSEYSFPQSARPPPLSESNGRPLIAYAKCKYVTWGKKRESRNNASCWPVLARLWKNSLRHAGIHSYQ